MTVTPEPEPLTPHVFEHPLIAEGPAEWEPAGHVGPTTTRAPEPEPLTPHVFEHPIVDTGKAEFEEILPNEPGVEVLPPDVEPLTAHVFAYPLIDVPEPPAAKKPAAKAKK